MPIRTYLTNSGAFDTETIRAMSRAFAEACAALHVFAGDERGRQLVARRVIDLARNTVIDETALRDRVLLEAKAMRGEQAAAAGGMRALSDDNVLNLEPRLKARADAAQERRKTIDRSGEHFRMLTRAVREMREKGATSKEIVHTLRTIADELEDRIA